ncbi:hypothetical protein M434DRAFT_221630 [Hypoxylon sp. CO27-5]|nr:hypothetical protein M434DRAFT_221630 [Hypoxylon sp. CO27-5]
MVNGNGKGNFFAVAKKMLRNDVDSIVSDLSILEFDLRTLSLQLPLLRRTCLILLLFSFLFLLPANHTGSALFRCQVSDSCFD